MPKDDARYCLHKNFGARRAKRCVSERDHVGKVQEDWVRTTVDDADDYVLSISAFTEQVAGYLGAQTKEVPASCGCRRVASAWFQTDDFWRLCRVINRATQQARLAVNLLMITTTKVSEQSDQQ